MVALEQHQLRTMLGLTSTRSRHMTAFSFDVPRPKQAGACSSHSCIAWYFPWTGLIREAISSCVNSWNPGTSLRGKKARGSPRRENFGETTCSRLHGQVE